jgi:uncharacterized HAD superfamily protein/NTP pyrophosphatase (non-canonical NTP hydrolase)
MRKQWSGFLDKLDEMWAAQDAFQIKRGLFNGDNLISETKEITLALLSEASGILQCIDWKPHRIARGSLPESNIQEEIIDVLKYWLIMARLHGMTPDSILEEFNKKTDVIQHRWDEEFLLDLSDSKCIAVDLDGVLCDYVGTWFKFCDEKGIEYDQNRLNYKSLDLAAGLKDPTAYPQWKHLFRNAGWKAKADVMPGAQQFLRHFKERGYKIALVSSRPYRQYRRIFPDTIEWLQKNELPYDALIFEENKREWVQKNAGAVLFMVEDDPDQALKMATFGINVYLMGTAYNKRAKHSKITRIVDLAEVIYCEIGRTTYEDSSD